MSGTPRSAFLPTGFTLSPSSIDPEVWATCAGPLLRIPPVGSLAVYCPQGHAEQRLDSIDAAKDLASRIPHPPQLLCQVLSVTLEADEVMEELSARYELKTASPSSAEAQRIWEATSPDVPGEDAWIPPARMGSEHAVWKVLSRSDIYGQGGLAVPKRAAEMCLPPLDMDMDQPSQNVAATDLFGNHWAFRHVIRGKPLRNLLTTNWNHFVAQKKLQAPDRVVLIRGENGRLKIGVRRSEELSSPPGRAGASRRPRRISPGTLASSESIFLESFQASQREGSVFQVAYQLRPHSNASFVVPLETFCKGLKQQRLLAPGRSLKMAFETMEFGIRRFRGQIVGNTGNSRLPSELKLQELPTQWRCVQVEWADNDLMMPKPSSVCPWDVALASGDPKTAGSPLGVLGSLPLRDPTPELPVRPLAQSPPTRPPSQGQLPPSQAHAHGELLSASQGPVPSRLGMEQLLTGHPPGARQQGDVQAMDVQAQGSQGLWGSLGEGQGQGGGQGGAQGGGTAELLSRGQRRDLWLSMQQQQQTQGQVPHLPPLEQQPDPQPLQPGGAFPPALSHPGATGLASFALGSLSSPELPSVLQPSGASSSSLLAGRQQARVHRTRPGALQTEQQAALDTFNSAVVAMELHPRHFLVAQEAQEEEGPRGREGQGTGGVGRAGTAQSGPERLQSFQERGTRGASAGLLPTEAGSEAILRSISQGAVSGGPRSLGPLHLGRASESEPSKGLALSPHPHIKREPSDSPPPPPPLSATAGSTPNPSPLGTAPSLFGDFPVHGSRFSPAADSEHPLRDSPTMGLEAMSFSAGTSRFADVGSSLQSPLGGSGSGSGSLGGGAWGEGGSGVGRHSVVVKRQKMEWASAAEPEAEAKPEPEAEAEPGMGSSEGQRSLWDIPQLSAVASMPERAPWPDTPTDSPTQDRGPTVTRPTGHYGEPSRGGAVQGLGTRFAPGAGERILVSGTGSLRERAMGTSPGEPQQGDLTAARQQQRLSGRLPPVWAPRRAHGSPSPLGIQGGEEHDLSLRLGPGFGGPGEREGAPAEEEKGQGQDPMQEGEPSAAPPAVTRWLMD